MIPNRTLPHERLTEDAADALTECTKRGASTSEAITAMSTDLRHLAVREGIPWSTIAGWAERDYIDHYAGEMGLTPMLGQGHPCPDQTSITAAKSRRSDTEIRNGNQARAEAAATAAVRFGTGDWDTAMIALLTALRHLADHHALDWSVIEWTAEHRYHAQARGER